MRSKPSSCSSAGVIRGVRPGLDHVGHPHHAGGGVGDRLASPRPTRAPPRRWRRRPGRRPPGPGRWPRRGPSARPGRRCGPPRTARRGGRRGRPRSFDQPVGPGHDPLAGHVAALLGPHLVLQEDAGPAGRLEQLHRAPGVEGVAVAGVGVDDHRRLGRGPAHPPGDVGHLPLGQVAEVGQAEEGGRRGVAGQEGHLEAGVGRQPGRQGVVDAGHEHGLARRRGALGCGHRSSGPSSRPTRSRPQVVRP